MIDPNWFEEKPTRDLKSRTEISANREIDRRTRLTQIERRRFFKFLNFEIIAGASLATLTAFLGFKMVTKEADDLEWLEPADIDLIANMDFLEDFETLEALNDEELSS